MRLYVNLEADLAIACCTVMGCTMLVAFFPTLLRMTSGF